jgi:hypothetical protein
VAQRHRQRRDRRERHPGGGRLSGRGRRRGARAAVDGAGRRRRAGVGRRAGDAQGQRHPGCGDPRVRLAARGRARQWRRPGDAGRARPVPLPLGGPLRAA